MRFHLDVVITLEVQYLIIFRYIDELDIWTKDPRLRGSQGARLADMHLSTRYISTPFTSWAASLHVAHHFSKDHQVAILDLHGLPHVEAYHVNEMCKHGLAPRDYSHEYLLHGKIEGEALSVIKAADLLKSIPGASILPPWSWGKGSLTLRAQGFQFIKSLDVEKVREIVASVRSARPHFVLPLAIAVLTYSGINFDIPKSTNAAARSTKTKQKVAPCRTPDSLQIDENMIRLIFQGLGDTSIPNEFCLDPNILLDRVYTEYYDDIAQMIYLLRKLTDAAHGRGVRGRLACLRR